MTFNLSINMMLVTSSMFGCFRIGQYLSTISYILCFCIIFAATSFYLAFLQQSSFTKSPYLFTTFSFKIFNYGFRYIFLWHFMNISAPKWDYWQKMWQWSTTNWRFQKWLNNTLGILHSMVLIPKVLFNHCVLFWRAAFRLK